MEAAGTSNFHSSAEDDSLNLPPGFRFHPTDEELVIHYLSPKVIDPGFYARAIAEVDLNKCEPWDLPRKAKMGEKEWYFFCMRDRKYPTGMRTNRATEAGYWKATGKDKEVYSERNILVGMKKTLVFYRGRAPKGDKTNWVMHEYRLEGKLSNYNLPKMSKNEWVVCRIFQKTSGIKIKGPTGPDQLLRVNSFGDELYSSTLPPLLDSACFPGEIDDEFKTLNMPRFPTTCIDGEGINNQKLLLESYPHLNQASPYMAAAGSSFSPTPQASSQLQIPLFINSQSMGKFKASFHHQEKNSSEVAAGTLFPYYDCTFDHDKMLKSNMEVGSRQNLMMTRQCKYGQKGESPQQEAAYYRFSNQSMISVSQDTGLSTDVTTEISSVVSNNQLGSSKLHDDQEGAPSSSAGPVDLECLWDY